MAELDKLALVLFCLCVVLRSYKVQGDDGLYLLPSGEIVAAKRGPDDPATLVVSAVARDSSSSVAAFEAGATDLLRNVTDLKVWSVSYWPSLPETSRIDHMDMFDVESVGVFGGCSQLTWLRISARGRFSCGPRWLQRCTRLRDLALYSFHVVDARAVLDATPPLRALALFLRDLKELHTVMRNPLFPTRRGREQSITELSITNSDVPLSEVGSWPQVSASIAEQLATLPGLTDLSIEELRGFDLCPPGNFSPVIYRSLERLLIEFSSTTRACFKELRVMPRLFNFTLQHNYIAGLFRLEQFRELFSLRAPNLYANVYENDQVADNKSFRFEKEDYFALIDGSRKGSVMLPKLRLSVECEWCRGGWLARALRERLLTARGVSCRDGRALQSLRTLLECDRITCIENCKCRRDWHQDVVIADCHGARLAALPTALLRLPRLAELNASNNRISDLPQQLPNNLLRLDLSGNALWPQNETAVSALFSTRARRVRLAGYSLVCTCDQQQTLQTLLQHHDQVEDYDNLQCVGTNKKLSAVVVSEVCEERDLEQARRARREAGLTGAMWAAVAAALGALAVAAALYWRRALLVFLFARGCCLCWLREHQLDADRRYDVFLSYCHADHRVVLEEILPTLDGEYSVCEHTRDWCPGETIPAQIMWSVEQSRRTLVILSRSFVESLWGVLEFRTAYASGLSAGRVRVVMVVLDDVLESGVLHGELRAYVRLNTYVRWGEPFFWDKLRYALPHRPAPPSPSAPPSMPIPAPVPRPASGPLPEEPNRLDMPPVNNIPIPHSV